jgi:diguanylate cyclase (GGDEF)-like protein
MTVEDDTADEAMHATVSIGVATFPWQGRTPKELTHEADQALYRAKEEGRNRVSGHVGAAVESPLVAVG